MGSAHPGRGADDATPDWHLRTVAPELEQRWRSEGGWTDDTLGLMLDRGLREGADTAIRIHSVVRPWSGTFADVREWALRLAAGLAKRGIQAGDPVAFQLPNSIEAAVAFYAASFLGAVIVPIVHFYGPKEVGYILRRTRVKAFITLDQFGHTNYLKALPRMRDDMTTVELIAVVGIDEAIGELVPFADLLAHAPMAGPVTNVDPAVPAIVAYTSGTTADPKGVIHTHHTVGAEVRQLAAMQAPAAAPVLVGAPVGHAIGMLSALLLPVVLNRPIHLTDVWDPPRILELMSEHQLACGSGATFFLTSLLDHPERTAEHLSLMRFVGLGGAAVPPAVAERATAAGISIVRLYGSTEHPSITGSRHDEPLDKRIHTDGRPLLGVELRLVDRDGGPAPVGEPGEILTRGPDCCMGYTDPDLTASAFDDEGWFHTGDVGVLDADGYLRITDRLTDVIIRGGENISAVEVEDLLAGLPGLLEVAVVAAPDDRLGERACAFVRIAPGAGPIPDLAWVRSVLAEAGLARQKWPEELRVINVMPRTPSGKVQKAVLRQMLRDEASRAADQP